MHFYFGEGGPAATRAHSTPLQFPHVGARDADQRGAIFPNRFVSVLTLLRARITCQASAIQGIPPSQARYQLNLVLNDPSERRVNLCDNTDVAWLQETGQRIADFLDRPFLDLVSQTAAETSHGRI